ncbi:glycosyltransferase [Candidatus Omnitrophota bacterium]
MSKIFVQANIKKVAQGAGVSFFGSFFGASIYGLTHLVIARLLGAELFGVFSLGFAIFGIAEILSRLGLHEGAVRYIALHLGEGDYRRAKGVVIESILFSFCAGIVIGSILFFTSGLIAERMFHNAQIARVIKVFSLGVPFGAALIVALYVTRGYQKIKYFVGIRNIFNPLANLFLIALFYIVGMRLYGAIAAWILSTILSLVFTIHLINRELKRSKAGKPQFETAKLIRFSLPLSLSDFLFFLIMWTDALMLGYFMTETEVGIYRAAVQIAFILTIFLRSFVTIFAPIISDLYNRKIKDQLESLLKITTKWISFLTLPFSIIVVFAADEVMGLFGESFVRGSHVLILLVIAQAIRCSLGPTRHMLMMSGHQRVVLYNDIIVAATNIILNLIFIPLYGMLGAAFATCISILGMSLIELAEVYVFLKMLPFKRSFGKGIVAALVTVFAVAFLQQNMAPGLSDLVRMAFISLVVALIYSVILFIQKIDPEDTLIISVVTNKFRTRREVAVPLIPKKKTVNRENPFISFIIVTRNRKSYLRSALTSVLKQEYQPYEIVVVDNGSDDGTDGLFKVEFNVPNIRYIKLEKNRGASEGRNVALKETKGEIIIGLDDDAEFVEKDIASKVAKKFFNDESIGVLSFKIIDHATGKVQRAAFPTRKKSASPEKEFETTWFISAGCAIPREVFRLAGPYRSFTYKGNEEIDLSYRILDIGYRIVYFPSVTVVHKKKLDGKIAGSQEYFAIFLENRLKVAFLNLPVRYVCSASVLWTLRILQCARGNPKPVIRAWRSLFRQRKEVGAKRKVIKKQTIFRIRRLKGPLVY